MFVTGSRVYGTPREDSDLDIVLSLTEQRALEEAGLFTLADVVGINVDAPSVGNSLRLGKLNFICPPTGWEYDVWFAATETLKAHRPITRSQAVELINDMLGRNPCQKN